MVFMIHFVRVKVNKTLDLRKRFIIITERIFKARFKLKWLRNRVVYGTMFLYIDLESD